VKHSYEMINDQELSTKWSAEFVNAQKEEIRKDVFLLNMMANGYASGAYMGLRWFRNGEQRGLFDPFKAALIKDNSFENRAEEAAVFCLKQKYQGVNQQDREVLKDSIVKGFRKAVEVYKAKGSTDGHG
jgi:hypothetical protein